MALELVGSEKVAAALRESAALNLAIVFVVESGSADGGFNEKQNGVEPFVSCTRNLGMECTYIEGTDVRRVQATMRGSIERARNGGGPSLLAVRTWPYQGHAASEPRSSATQRSLAREDTDPIAYARARILSEKIATERTLSDLDKRIRDRVREAAATLSDACSAETAKGMSHAG